MAPLLRIDQGSTHGVAGQMLDVVVGVPFTVTDVNGTAGPRVHAFADVPMGPASNRRSALHRGSQDITNASELVATATLDVPGEYIWSYTAGSEEVRIAIRAVNPRGWAKPAFNPQPGAADPALNRGGSINRGYVDDWDAILDDTELGLNKADTALATTVTLTAQLIALTGRVAALEGRLLVAGPNVTLTPDGAIGAHNVTVAASGGGSLSIGAILAGAGIEVDPPEGDLTAGPVTIINTGGGGSPPPPPPPVVYFDFNQSIVTGQSLAFGYNGNPALTHTDQLLGNKMFNSGPTWIYPSVATSFQPLLELGDGTNGLETIQSGLANEASVLANAQGDSYTSLMCNVAVSNTPYSGLKRGTAAYTKSILMAQTGHNIAQNLGKTHAVRAIVVVHGENDEQALNTDYAANVVEWQSNYEEDIQALYGQTVSVPLFHTQVASWTKYGHSTPTVALAQKAAVDLAAPNKVYLVGPKYQYVHSDGIHLNNQEYRRLGSKHGQVQKLVFVDGIAWKPLQMRQAVRTGNQVVIDYDVPSGPIVIDTTLVTDPAAQLTAAGLSGTMLGFEYVSAAGGPLAITAVNVTGPSQITLTLAFSGTGGKVRYAYTGVVGQNGGPTTGPRGCVRDSDPTLTREGGQMFNHAVVQELAVS